MSVALVDPAKFPARLVGNGVTTVFPFQYKILAKDDLLVYVAGALQTVDVNYTVAGFNSDAGGTVTFISGAPANGAAVIIQRAIGQKRTTDYQQDGDFLSTTVNPDFDNPVLQIQDLQEMISRSLRIPVTTGVADTEIDPVNYANKYQAYDALGRPTPAAFVAGTLTQSIIGELLYPRTDAEIAAGVTPSDYSIPSTALDDAVHVRRYGEDEAALLDAIKVLAEGGSVLDLDGLSIPVFVGVAGVTSGDCVALAAVPRLYGLTKDVTVRNGKIYADTPSVSGTKYRFPSTFVVDGCTGKIKLENVRLISKGENWGNSDASSGLGAEDRRAFLAQNGGHAIAVIRSKHVEADSKCRFELAGSVGSFYSSSSELVVLNGCYSSPQSLGYAAYCADSWCGAIAASGFVRHELILNNCRTDNNGSTYGSKGCVVGEDADVVIRVNGGFYKDAYANGAAHHIGYAFAAGDCAIYISGAQVDNVASLTHGFHSINGTTTIVANGCVATNVRTAGHIEGNHSFGTTNLSHENCHVTITGTSVWSEDELSIGAYIANMKQASTIRADIINCRSSGAHTFEINMVGCYGGIRVVGGTHEVTDRIFDSNGWGGSAAGTERGYEVLGGAKFFIMDQEPAVSLRNANAALCDIANYDGTVYTYQLIHFDRSCTVAAKLRTDGSMNSFASITTSGGLGERKICSQRLINAYQSFVAGEPFAQSIVADTLVGISGANYQVVFTFNGNRPPSGGYLIDNAYANRSLISSYSGPTVSAGKLQYGYYINGTTANLTAAGIYTMQSSG